ncbi:hypothetical protein JCM5350_005947, partial [Sporobolomyces pararoseus]
WAKNNLKHSWISAGVNAAASLVPEAHRRLASLRDGTSTLEGSHHVEDLATDTSLSLHQLVESALAAFTRSVTVAEEDRENAPQAKKRKKDSTDSTARPPTEKRKPVPRPKNVVGNIAGSEKAAANTIIRGVSDATYNLKSSLVRAMSSPFVHQLASLIESGSPPSSIYIHSPSSSPSLPSTVLSILEARTAYQPSEDSTPTVHDLLPKFAHLDLEQIHSTKQLFDRILNQLVGWQEVWNDADMGVANWEESRGFEGLEVVKVKRSKRRNPNGHTSEQRQRKRQRMMDDAEDYRSDEQQNQDLSQAGEEESEWKLQWNLAATLPPAPNKLAPIRNTLEAFHHSLTSIFDLASSTTRPQTDEQTNDFDFQPGISLSLQKQTPKSSKYVRRYIVIEHVELLGDLAGGAGGGGGLSGAAKETGIGMTFTSAIHRLAQLSELPITVIVLSRFPYRKSRETLVGLPSPYVLDFPEPTLENSIPLLHSRFTSSSLFAQSRAANSRLSIQDLSTLFKTFLQLLAMTLQSAIGNDLEQLSWWSCKLWPECIQLVEGSNPPIPPDRLDRLKIAMQPLLNATLGQLNQPRPSLLPARFRQEGAPGGETGSSDSMVRHGFAGVIREAPKAPTYLAPVNDSPTRSTSFASASAASASFELEPPPLRPFPLTSNPSSSSSLSTAAKPSTTSSSSLTKTLPTISRFLLIAAYLAAHNPPKSDVRMFVKVDELEGVAKKGKKSKRGSKKIQAGVSPKKKKGNLAAFMSGGKPFAYERLIAIFESILDEQREFAIGSISVHSSVQTLLSLRLLLKASGEKTDKGALDGVRLKCPLSRDEVDALGKGVGWPEWKERLVDIDD